MKKSTSSLLMMGAVAMLAGTGLGSASMDRDATEARAATAKSGVQKNSPSRMAEQNRLKAAFNNGYAQHRGPRRWPGTGWPVATDRRRAKKARNVARNRAAHR